MARTLGARSRKWSSTEQVSDMARQIARAEHRPLKIAMPQKWPDAHVASPAEPAPVETARQPQSQQPGQHPQQLSPELPAGPLVLQIAFQEQNEARDLPPFGSR